MRKQTVMFSSISPETRKKVYDAYVNEEDNSYKAIGEKFGFTPNMVGRIVEVELGEYRKNKTA